MSLLLTATTTALLKEMTLGEQMFTHARTHTHSNWPEKCKGDERHQKPQRPSLKSSWFLNRDNIRERLCIDSSTENWMGYNLPCPVLIPLL